jgi:hypothetical protein
VLGAFEPARDDLEAALAIADAIGERLARAPILRTLGELCGGHRDYQRGLDLRREAVRAAEAAGEPRATAETLVRSGLMRRNRARLTESRGELERELEREQLADAYGGALTLNVLGMVDGIRGYIEQYVARQREALRRF